MKRIDAADHNDRTLMKVAPASYAPTGALVLHARERVKVERSMFDDRVVMAWRAGFGSEATRKAYRADVRDWRARLDAHDASLPRAARVPVDLYARGLEAAGRAPSTAARRLAALASPYTSEGASRLCHATVRPHARAAGRSRGLHRRLGARLKNADRLSFAEPPVGLR